LKKRVISLSLFILILAALISQINIKDIYSIVNESSYELLGALFFILSASYFLRCLRFRVLLKRHKVPVLKLYAIVCCHSLFNHVMPARSGEASYPLFLKNKFNISYSEGIATLFVARVLDLVTVLCCFAGALLINDKVSINYTYTFTILVLVLAFSVSCLFVIPIADFMLALFEKTTSIINFKNKKIIEGVMSSGNKIKDYFSEPDIRQHILAAFVLSFLTWGMTFSFFYVALINFGIKIGASKVILGATGCVFSNLLPINALGSVGTWEAGWAVGFTLMGLNRALAVSSGFGIHILTILYGAVLALFAWLYLNNVSST